MREISGFVRLFVLPGRGEDSHLPSSHSGPPIVKRIVSEIRARGRPRAPSPSLTFRTVPNAVLPGPVTLELPDHAARRNRNVTDPLGGAFEQASFATQLFARLA